MSMTVPTTANMYTVFTYTKKLMRGPIFNRDFARLIEPDIYIILSIKESKISKIYSYQDCSRKPFPI